MFSCSYDELECLFPVLVMFKRSQFDTLKQRLSAQRRHIQVMMGPRQLGKSTLAAQLVETLQISIHTASGDSAYNMAQSWIQQQWTAGRQLDKEHGAAVLILDEIQKVDDWSAVVKQLWDEDTKNNTNLKVLLGSSSLMLQAGLTESLAGRFEIINIPHWSFAECQEAFGLTVDEFIFFGILEQFLSKTIGRALKRISRTL